MGSIKKSMSMALVISLMLAGPTLAVTLNFGAITANGVGSPGIAESQLTVDVTDSTGGMDLTATTILFTFKNSGPAASSITDVYFDDGTLLALSDLIDADQNGGDAGVDFSPLAAPGNLPSANTAPGAAFVTTAGFSADSDAPAQPNGVNPGESLGVFFTLQAGQTLADTYAALQQGIGVGGLRIGIHVQGFANGASESLVNTPCQDPTCGGGGGGGDPIPEPSTVLLFGSGLAGLGLWRWKSTKK